MFLSFLEEVFLLFFLTTVLPVAFLATAFLVFLTEVLDVVFFSSSFSSSDFVNLHFGNPLQPINSPYLPDLFIRSLPQSGHTPTISLEGSLSSLPHLGSRQALCLGFPNEIRGSPHSSQVVLRTVAPIGIE